ncbi:MAG: HPr family phosphocarrier protein [Roseiflexaceae bacterium]|nr:HPr family phosphocarrier protein [Roseiflexaceae bacterium]
MIETTVTIRNHYGLHARPAALFYRKIRQYRCAVTIQNLSRPDSAEVTVSPLHLLQIGVRQGDAVRLRATGDDADMVIADLMTLIETNFGD